MKVSVKLSRHDLALLRDRLNNDRFGSYESELRDRLDEAYKDVIEAYHGEQHEIVPRYAKLTFNRFGVLDWLSSHNRSKWP